MRAIALFAWLFIPVAVFAQASLHLPPGSGKLSVYFELNKSELNDMARSRLDSVGRSAVADSTLRLRIYGFTDYLASNDYNQKLSMQRAQSVSEYLQSKNVSPRQITALAGRGELPDSTRLGSDPGMPRNRRVDILVIKGTTPVPLLTPTSDLKKLSEMKAGDRLVLDKLFFIPGRHYLRQESFDELKKLLQVMKDNSNLRIEIQGHICCQSTRADGLDHDTGEWALSRNRAKYIYDYLVENGIDPGRMSYRGFGRSKPLVPVELTEDDRNRNRRVEVVVR